MVSSTGSVEYNTDSSSDSPTDSDDNASDSAYIPLTLKTVNQTRSGRKAGHFILTLDSDKDCTVSMNFVNSPSFFLTV